MIRHSKTQEKQYFKLKKQREKEQKKKALKRLERIKQLEHDRAAKQRQKEILKEKKKTKKGRPGIENSLAQNEDNDNPGVQVKQKR